MKIVVGATAAGHKAGEATRWLAHAEAMRAATPHEIDFFLAAEMRPDGQEPRLEAGCAQVRTLGGSVWKFMIDDGAERIDAGNRLIRICEGRNLVIEFALRRAADWIFFVDADLVVPADAIIRMLELRHPFCGIRVDSYCLSGPPVAGYEFPVEAYQNTAGAWFVHRSLFRFFRWLWDPDDGLTDDPATYRVIRDRLGCEQYNRGDVHGEHMPLVPFEARAADRGVARGQAAAHVLTAVIPVYFCAAGHVQMTADILERVFGEPVGRVYVLDNGGEVPFTEQARALLEGFARREGARLQVMAMPGRNIHELWNAGWLAALRDFGDEVLIAFLNNDIDFRPGTLEVLARAVQRNEIWVSYPDPGCRVADGARLTGRTRATRGSKRHGGMTGHCFLIKGGMHTRMGFPLFDAGYQSWYGDDDFAFRVEEFGFELHCVEGLPCDHLNEATMRHRPDLIERREADRRRFVHRWGDR